MSIEWHKNLWMLVYDDTPPGDDPPADDPPADDPPADDPEFGDLSDEHKKRVEVAIKKRLERERKKSEPLIRELETLKKTTGLTKKEKENLEKQIDDLKNQYLTKEELAAKERQKESKKHEQVVQELSTERDSWKNRFYDSNITRELTDAAAKADAFNVSQVVALLKGSTELVEKTNEDGQATGVFEARVKFNGRDSANKPMVMDLTVSEAIAEMQKMEDTYGNLFKSGLKDGLGSGNVTTGNGPLTIPKTHEEYMKNREKIKATV